ncbi:MAG TPA: hypothetical protein VGR28_00760 [Candidatus Thermoplasmatota archaeon]|jgi:flagellar protein FlaF|nr:hypothetical protein [Candidatus Thermoplasmatota archaeon]
MGISGPVAAAILVSALLAQAGTLVGASRNADTKVEEARQAWERRHEDIGAHDLAIASATWNGGQKRLTLNVDNTGTATMNGARVVVLLDGAYANANLTSRLVDGKTTDVWAPDQALALVLTWPSKPTDAAVISPWGRQDAVRGI